ncbi:hypothetical protein HPB49_003590 [Dermacentor silvarum]|uniref:Uncharacterized protein n=1 Tax=Dermacentor silvarum TaxID=543639 RepID=A0ACB8DTD0_DERSI|nr:hypothetical protein HPB49_003590 [Dermacentor silvarum]
MVGSARVCSTQARRTLLHSNAPYMPEGDHGFFFKFYRMTPQMFNTLLAFVVTDLTSQNFIREPLEPAERLLIALSYLASGQDICHVALAYRVGIETARMCIHVTCLSIWARLKDHYMKGTFSVVLMAVVDSNCKHTLIDVGVQGRLSDGGRLKNSEFGRAVTQGDLDIPSTSLLPGCGTNAPYAFVCDEAFQLRKDFLRRYPARQLDDEKRVFNYRLRRARPAVFSTTAPFRSPSLLHLSFSFFFFTRMLAEGSRILGAAAAGTVHVEAAVVDDVEAGVRVDVEAGDDSWDADAKPEISDLASRSCS